VFCSLTNARDTSFDIGSIPIQTHQFMKETARIQILGFAGTGKTTLTLVIKKALAEHGINCNITGIPFEEDFKNEEILPKAIAYMKGMTVPIQTIQINRNVFQNFNEV
jgi:Ni2+-binding GTPase involved in maturation of urease and hydrogenase